MGLFKRFLHDHGGVTSILFGLMLVPAVMFVGFSVDYVRALNTRTHMQNAIDAAALAAASMGDLSNNELKANIERFFKVNYTGDKTGHLGALNIRVMDGAIEVDATGYIDTYLLTIAGYDRIDVATTTRVVIGNRKLELALVLDNTGSMNSGGKIEALRNAARKLVNILYGNQGSNPNLRIALVPFVTAVNIRATSFDWQWIDTNGAATYHGINFDESGGAINHLDLFSRISNTEWKGCAEARAEPYDVDDTPPSAGDPDTRWVPYFWPDEPDVGPGDYDNNYLRDKIGGNPARRQSSTKKYDGSSAVVDEVPSTTSGPNKSCARPIIPLVDDNSLLISEIDAMDGWDDSGTNIAQGMVWGWRVLSPEPPFSEGEPYDDDHTQKAMIVLTDGENMIWGGWNSHNKSHYNAYGYLAVNRLGTQDRDAAIEVVNDKTKAVCQSVKDKGIALYTITFKVDDSTTQELMRGCASSPSMYFNSPSNSELEDIFTVIAKSLLQIRIAS